VKTNTVQNNSIFESVKATIEEARNKAKQSINHIMTEAYWNIGRLIVEDEQKGSERATYGEGLIKELSERLSEEYGKGFSQRNLRSMRSFYLAFPILQTLSAKLSWSHYLLILKIEDEKDREWQIKKLKEDDKLERIGGAKGGHWEVKQ